MPDLTLGAGVTVVIPDPAVTITLEPPAMPGLIVVPVTGPRGPEGDGTVAADLAAHISSPTPHPAYDTDLQSLTILFENGLS